MRERIRRGDHDAFGELFDEHGDVVLNHAFRLTHDWTSAEEAMGETFLVAWRRRTDVDPAGGSLRPWLLGIATHQALNLKRRTRRRVAFLLRQPAPRQLADFAEETVGRLDDQAVLVRAKRALALLDRHETEVLSLCVWSGLSYAEAAEALGVPVGTVRSRLSRARRRLRALTEVADDVPDLRPQRLTQELR